MYTVLLPPGVTPVAVNKYIYISCKLFSGAVWVTRGRIIFESRPCSSVGLRYELVDSRCRLLLAFHVPRWPLTPHFVAVECVVLQVRCVKGWRKYS